VPGREQFVGEVLALDDELRRALFDRDLDVLERLYAPEFVINTPASRIQTRQETLALVARSDMRQVHAERTVEAAYASGDDIVVIMGRESFEWEGTGTDLDGRRTARRFTNVWRRIDGRWQHIARQATTIPLDS
jgi:hypothetical protein